MIYSQKPIKLNSSKFQLSNAIKFTEAKVNKKAGKERGIININAEKQDDLAIISVKDRGTGIDPDVVPRLFTKFAMKSDKGTGLGLYISKSIVEAHGGNIWAENNNDDGNEGATFTFTLPRSEKREANKR